MEQPLGFISKKFANHVCLLKRVLYSLKQALCAWFGKIAKYLYFCHFKLLDANPSLFLKKMSTIYTILLSYVDDMIITGDNNVNICL